MEFENDGRVDYAEIARGIYENADQDIDTRYAPRGLDDGVDTGSLESEVNPTRELGQNQTDFNVDSALEEHGLNFSDEDAVFFKELGLKPEQSQKALERLKAFADHSQAYWEAQSDRWQDELSAIYGPTLDDAAEDVNNVLTQYDTNGELVKLLDQTGFQNCAPLFKLLHAVSQDLRR